MLKPLWHRTPETASRLRSRIERILDFAKVNGWRSGENAATWRGNLALALPSPRKLNRVEHHAALPYPDLPAFMLRLRQREEVTARAMEFLILTAARTNEVIGARWSEVDEREKVWKLAAVRMKGAEEHVVPLSDRALAILESLRPEHEADDFIFKSRGQALSNMALLALLKRMKAGVTAHGFRSSFRDWAAEQTNHQHEVAEAALAHKIKSKVEAAYRRGTMLTKRRAMMSDWAAYCAGGSEKMAKVA